VVEVGWGVRLNKLAARRPPLVGCFLFPHLIASERSDLWELEGMNLG
jgi:hypothetical protein